MHKFKTVLNVGKNPALPAVGGLQCLLDLIEMKYLTQDRDNITLSGQIELRFDTQLY